MKNKILCACLCTGVAFGATTALATEKTITYNLQGSVISNISMENDELCKLPTITLLNSDKTAAIYVNDGTSVESDNGYTLTFDNFTIPSSIESGTLYLRVGGENVDTVTVPISYKSPGEIYTALNDNLNVATADTIHQTMLDYGAKAGGDMTYYEKMPAVWYNAIDEAVLALDLSVADDYSDLYEKQGLFIDVLNKISAQYVICASDDKAAAVELIEKSDILGFDRNEFYAKADTTAIYTYINGKNVSPANADTQITLLFDESVAKQCIENQDWNTVEKMLKYYKSKGRINFDFTTYDQLSSLDKVTVIGSLKTSGSTEFAKISPQLAQAISALSQSGGDGGSHSSTSGGGGGGGSYMPTVTAPVTDTPIEYVSTALKDLDSVSWAKDAIESLYKENIISGFDDGNYYPESDVTREQFIKTVVAAFGITADGAKKEFSDVERNAWYYNYIMAACNSGIIEGLGDDEFGIGMNLTREDMAVIICRTLEHCGVEIEDATLDFTDKDEVSDYAKSAVAFLAEKEIISGMGDGRFEPKSFMTRAQMAVIVRNAIDMYRSYEIGG